ncbi:MAG: CPBP family intramembrane metalloprotease [Balneola sp.]|mgnify:FL=1|jgi:membrane protease YdiL (CAAX protease family)|nr:CPBP family intramembrane metalloprotease [Balneola sp.]MBE80284.1 CPBP family intramembrane metalloprotease [Balneola sp.]|tara:strand:- start:214 stop:924 length:711 start_codon:yes stop_codon:yes gene_type:complete
MIFAASVLLLSCILYYLVEKENLLKVWFTPVSTKLKHFLIGFLTLALLSTISQLFFGYLSGATWFIAPEISLKSIYASALYDLRSVLFEELTFRGIALYFLFRFTKKRQLSLLISAAGFGIYHWFTFGVLGNPIPMIAVFITTGLMGYAFALALEKTNSIVLPIALHLGWNLINNTVFSNGPLGIQLLQANLSGNPIDLGGYYDLISLAWYIFIPSLVILMLNRFFTRQTKDFKLM